MTSQATAPTQTTPLSFPVTGMSCAACVGRVEKVLAKLDGVQEAQVNLATETARVLLDPSAVTPEQVRAAVERAGYGVGALPAWPATELAAQTRPPEAAPAEAAPAEARAQARQHELFDLRRKSLVSLSIGAALMALMYLPMSHATMLALAPLQLIAATLAQFWAGASFYRAAWAALRHGATNMNTLVAVGTSVAYGYSAFVTLWPELARAWDLPVQLYFESAVFIVGLVLLGRRSAPWDRGIEFADVSPVRRTLRAVAVYLQHSRCSGAVQRRLLTYLGNHIFRRT